jgi:hypothetical protein
MKKTSLLLCAVALLGFAANSQALTYYVDSVAGSDNNGGNSTSAPWKTLAKVSRHYVAPGDWVLLKKGDTWSESPTFVNSGASGAPITFGTYGTGNAPIIKGMVSLSDVSYVTLSGLMIENSATLIYIDGGSHIIVTGCALKNAGTFGIRVLSSPKFTFSNSTYSLDPTFYMYGDVIRVQISSDSPTVTGNTVTLNQTSHASAGLYFMDVNNVTVASNTVTGGSQQIGIKADTKDITGALVHDNAVYYPDHTAGDGEGIEFTGTTSTNVTVSGSIYHNFVRCNSNTNNAISGFMAKNVMVYNNIVIGPIQDAAFHWSTNSPGGLFYGNTVYNAPIGFNIISGSGSAHVFNNIVSEASFTPIESDSTTASTISEDYNTYFLSGSIFGLNRGSHDNTADPEFVTSSPAGPLDVKVQSSSPALRSGYSLNAAYKEALNLSSTSFPATLVDQTLYGWNRGAFGQQ